MAESSYGRMILATLMVITVIAVAIMSYSIVVIPLEYTVDVLQDAYTDVDSQMEYGDTDEFNKTILSLPAFLAAGVVFLVILVFIWYFVYAHKKEHELD